MNEAWEYLSSGELVFKVQQFFGVEKVDKDDKVKFRIGNKLFHYLFLFGTELGDCPGLAGFCSLIKEITL